MHVNTDYDSWCTAKSTLSQSRSYQFNPVGLCAMGSSLFIMHKDKCIKLAAEVIEPGGIMINFSQRATLVEAGSRSGKPYSVRTIIKSRLHPDALVELVSSSYTCVMQGLRTCATVRAFTDLGVMFFSDNTITGYNDRLNVSEAVLRRSIHLSSLAVEAVIARRVLNARLKRGHQGEPVSNTQHD